MLFELFSFPIRLKVCKSFRSNNKLYYQLEDVFFPLEHRGRNQVVFEKKEHANLSKMYLIFSRFRNLIYLKEEKIFLNFFRDIQDGVENKLGIFTFPVSQLIY